VWGLWWRKLEERKQLGKCKRNWADNIKIDVKGIGWKGGGTLTGLNWLGINTSGGLL